MIPFSLTLNFIIIGQLILVLKDLGNNGNKLDLLR